MGTAVQMHKTHTGCQVEDTDRIQVQQRIDDSCLSLYDMLMTSVRSGGGFRGEFIQGEITQLNSTKKLIAQMYDFCLLLLCYYQVTGDKVFCKTKIL